MKKSQKKFLNTGDVDESSFLNIGDVDESSFLERWVNIGDIDESLKAVGMVPTAFCAYLLPIAKAA